MTCASSAHVAYLLPLHASSSKLFLPIILSSPGLIQRSCSILSILPFAYPALYPLLCSVLFHPLLIYLLLSYLLDSTRQALSRSFIYFPGMTSLSCPVHSLLSCLYPTVVFSSSPNLVYILQHVLSYSFPLFPVMFFPVFPSLISSCQAVFFYHDSSWSIPFVLSSSAVTSSSYPLLLSSPNTNNIFLPHDMTYIIHHNIILSCPNSPVLASPDNLSSPMLSCSSSTILLILCIVISCPILPILHATWSVSTCALHACQCSRFDKPVGFKAYKSIRPL